MEAIGFDLYMEMLQDCLAEIQGQDIPAVDETQIDLPVTAFIPADWITEADEKMAAYRAAAECGGKAALVELAAGWADRYGPIPAPVQSLLQLMELKLLARRCGFSRIKPEKPNIALEQLMAWLTAMAGQIPEADGRTPEQRAEEQAATNAAVLVV
jgi:transcription-repair coupling factor (superfamily II helicase)